jgi:hypothetical protein
VNVRDAAELERIILARIDAVNRQLSMMWRVVSCLPRIDRATWGGGRDVSRTGRVHFRVHCRLCYRRLLESDLWHGRGASAGGFWRSRRLNIGIGCCARYKWPRRRRAAEQRDELAAVHSITSSARASSVGGISRPSALAALRLMTSWNFDACSTGRSAGLAPLRILSM